ncbi:DUF222 domain-containing protein [Gordonia sp. NPDC003585]|uniref:HNH endonuclease signature motif containing protein n=1 Tax=Gordonia sp. NPDC003585 TaxID=3154275 RepID=UPI0033ABDDBF
MTTTIGGTSRAAELVAQVHALLDELVEADLTACTDDELVEVAAAHEQALARMTYAGDRQLVEVSDRDLPHRMGYRSPTNFFNARLRVSDPGRRRAQMAVTATFRQPTGEEREPRFPAVAEAFAEGSIGHGHIRAVLDTLDQIPHTTPHDVQVAAERQMVDIAKEHTPNDIATAGQRLLGHLDPDGTLSDDADRARRRNLWMNKQRADGTSKLTGTLDPVLANRFATMLAAWAQPGMNNPQDPESPSGPYEDADPNVVAAAALRDGRSVAQCNHDALNALLKAVLEDGLLGTTHRGLPIQLIIKANLADLVRGSGVATTATGGVIPISELIGMAGQVQPWLAIFDGAKPEPLFLGRGKRLASMAQRLASFVRIGGERCSAPDCDQPATHVEIHHAKLDFALGGNTDITELYPACPPHNRRVGPKPGQFTTWIIEDGPDAGRCAWRLNAHPGAPPNPARIRRIELVEINRFPDIAAGFTAHLNRVRAEIHGPPDDGDTQATEDSVVGHFRLLENARTRNELARLQLRQTINPESVIENRLVGMLEEHLGIG